ncbi:ATP-binding protein [Paenibacillus sp. SYP-B4298]|uniref:ATP-binding protein n=1 Tax=Paenibacillus sp. SYP-B4298 TaxID=2996034 RepID=UPI0022DD1D6D|nr:ATP-binding protein [Paenibacillus sp. SYP-B4298]
MTSWRQLVNGKITRRFSSRMLLSMLFILAGATFVLWSTIHILQKYSEETAAIYAKGELVKELGQYSSEIVMRSRGYFLFLNEYELSELTKLQEQLEVTISSIQQMQLSDRETQMIQDIRQFFQVQFQALLPEAIELAKQGDYEELRRLIPSGESNPVNQMIAYAQEFEHTVSQGAGQAGTKLLSDLTKQGGLFILYILLVLLVSLLSVRRVAVDVGRPLSQLAQQVGQFGRGGRIELEGLDSREDELGKLARSFQQMLSQIQSKEEELLAQNEELQAQQDELQAQQEELQEAIQTLEENEEILKNRNQFIQTLANTLDKGELLYSIIHNVVRYSNFDKGVLVMLSGSRDYASSGISAESAAAFVASLDDSPAARCIETLEPYLLVREASDGERGYHPAGMQSSDLFIPIENSRREVVALLVVTRIGGAITRHDENELLHSCRQVALALAKLEMYEETEQQRQLTRDMINTIQEGIQFINLEGETIEINDKMGEFFDFFQADVFKRGLTLQVLTEQLQKRVVEPAPLVAFIQQVVSGVQRGSQSIQYELNHPQPRHMLLYSEPLYRDDERFGLLLVHRDMTREHEVDRMKSEFVSTVSHELRTPLASVLGFAELLLHRELKPERQRKYIHTIHQEARRLTTLINDFLDLQRMESGKQSYVTETVDMKSLIEEALEAQRVNTSQHELVAEWGELPYTVVGDRDKLRQVLTNLLSNAVKYSPQGGEIHVKCRRDGERLLISVQDQGLGIPREALPKLFNKFYRVDNSDRREIGGTGLGLAIVKEILHQHNGDIAVESCQGVGSTFTIDIPLYEPSVSDLDHDGVAPHSAPVVMLVENDHNLSRMLRDELLGSGFRVELYTEGRKALERLQEQKPDLIVLDLLLEEGIDGWDVIEHMKKSAELTNTPIIISSAFEEKDKAAQWGIRDFLVKPYLPGILSAVIKRLLEEK